MSERKTVKMMCLGYIILTGNILGVEFQDIDSKRKWCFKKSKSTDKIPGSLYTAETEGDSMYGGMEWDGMSDDKTAVLEAQVTSKMNKTKYDCLRREKKMKSSNDELLECLRPLSKAYHSTNHEGKAALMAQVMIFMQREL